MKKKKELPRKRKRFIKKVIFLSIFLLVFVLITSSVSYYIFVFKLQKPLYISPLSHLQTVQVDKSDNQEELLKKGLKKEQIAYVAIKRINNSYVVTLTDGGKVTFSSQKDIMTQIASLQYILSHLTMEGRQFSSLDLRFEQPVIMIK